MIPSLPASSSETSGLVSMCLIYGGNLVPKPVLVEGLLVEVEPLLPHRDDRELLPEDAREVEGDLAKPEDRDVQARAEGVHARVADGV